MSNKISEPALRRDFIVPCIRVQQCTLRKSTGSQPRICLRHSSQYVPFTSAVPLIRQDVLIGFMAAAGLRMKASMFGIEIRIGQQRYILILKNGINTIICLFFCGLVLRRFANSRVHSKNRIKKKHSLKFPEHSRRL